MSGCSVRNAGHLAFASCTRLSPKTRCPAATTGPVRSSPCPFDTATSVVKGAGRIAAARAFSMRDKTSASAAAGESGAWEDTLENLGRLKLARAPATLNRAADCRLPPLVLITDDERL